MSIALFGDTATKEVYIDTTVQEKNVTYSVDANLYRKIRIKVRIVAKREGIALSWTFATLLVSPGLIGTPAIRLPNDHR